MSRTRSLSGHAAEKIGMRDGNFVVFGIEEIVAGGGDLAAGHASNDGGEGLDGLRRHFGGGLAFDVGAVFAQRHGDGAGGSRRRKGQVQQGRDAARVDRRVVDRLRVVRGERVAEIAGSDVTGDGTSSVSAPCTLYATFFDIVTS